VRRIWELRSHDQSLGMQTAYHDIEAVIDTPIAFKIVKQDGKHKKITMVRYLYLFCRLLFQNRYYHNLKTFKYYMAYIPMVGININMI